MPVRGFRGIEHAVVATIRHVLSLGGLRPDLTGWSPLLIRYRLDHASRGDNFFTGVGPGFTGGRIAAR